MSLTDHWLWAAGVGAGVATLLGVSFWITLPTAGIVHALASSGRRVLAGTVTGLAVMLAVAIALVSGDGSAIAGVAGHAAEALSPGHAPLLAVFLSGLKAGLLTFGGAYTAIPFIRQDIAGRGWMSDGQFLDGVALSGMLPAPLIIFATFVGYAAGGVGGALAMTAGVFLPAFAFSLVFYERLEAVLENAALRSLLDGVAAGVVGLIAATTFQLAAGLAAKAGTPVRLLVLAVVTVAAVAVVYRWKSPFASPAIVIAAGAAGAVLLA